MANVVIHFWKEKIILDYLYGKENVNYFFLLIVRLVDLGAHDVKDQVW